MLNTTDLADHVDWRSEGAVSTPKDQKKCGACYAFVVAAALEALVKKKYGILAELSVQQLIDCSSQLPWNNFGCSGGLLPSAF